MAGKKTIVADDQETYFDTPARTNEAEICENYTALHADVLLREILEGHSDPAVLLDQNRQMVTLNSLAADLFKSAGTPDAIGKRIGEAIHCIHAAEMPAGCGTSPSCAHCGVAAAIRRTTHDEVRDRRDARVTTRIHGKHASLDVRTTSAVLHWKGRTLTLVSLKDISDAHRREALEKIFFHDVLNTAGSVHGIATLLPDTTDSAELSELYSMLNSSGEQLIREIEAQRDLVRAEEGDLAVSLSEVTAGSILDGVRSLYRQSPLTDGKEIRFAVMGNDFAIKTDRTILVRCVGNLVKNALEASARGQKVAVTASCQDSAAVITVKNEGVMPEDVCLQVFQRSFSTKAASGRGLGTYSVKLLVEQYLRGIVGFSSTAGTGTIFTIEIPFHRGV
jgi:K+-sensing histidine kinase KdpD